MKNFFKKNIKEKDGILIVLIFIVIIGLGLSGVLDYLFQFIITVFNGFFGHTNPDYVSGETFPF